MFISLYPASSAFPALGQSTTLQRRCWAFFISKSRVCQNLLRVSCSLNSSLLSSGSGQRREGSLYTEKTGRSVFTLIWALHQGGQRQLECILLRAAIGRKSWGVRHRTGSCVPLLSGLIPSSKSVRKYALCTMSWPHLVSTRNCVWSQVIEDSKQWSEQTRTPSARDG